MLGDIFENVFQASMRASLLIITVFLLKAAFRHKINIRWHTAIWVIVAVRLVIPWAPQSPFSMFNAVKPAEKAVKQVLQAHGDSLGDDFNEQYRETQSRGYETAEKNREQSPAAGGTNNETVKEFENQYSGKTRGNVISGPKGTVGKPGFPEYFAWIWLSGSVIFAFMFAVINMLLYVRIKKRGVKLDSGRINQIMDKCRALTGISSEIGIYEAEGINSPLLFGIRRPVVVLPRGMADTLSDTELRHIILHELIHLRKRDNLRLTVALSIRAIHWFNPLVHLAAAEYTRSNERYCDSRVLECLDDGENKDYGRTLVRLARGCRGSIPGLSSAIYGRAESLEMRVKNIAGFTKGACRWSITAVIALVLAACGGLSNEIDTPEYMKNLTQEEIHIYTQYTARQKDEVENMLNEVHLKLSDSIMVTPVFHWMENDTYEDEIEKLVKSGERVDAFTTYGGYRFKNRDVLMDLTDMFPKYAPNYYSELTSHSVGIEKLKSSTSDGKLICVPNNDLLTQRSFVVARKDLAEMFAPDGFETYEDYGRFLAKVKEHNSMMAPGEVSARSYFEAYLQGNGYFNHGATFFYKRWDPKYRDEFYPMERTEEFKTAYYMLKEWDDKGYIIKDGNDINYWLSKGALASILVNGTSIDSYLNSISSEYEFVVDPLYMDSPHRAFIVGKGVSVGNTCTCPERVMMFLEWIHSSQEAYDLFIYGVENRNYILKGDKISFASEEFDIKQIQDNITFGFFRDFRYDRLYDYQPDDYKEIYRDACLKNIMTSEEVTEKVMGVTSEKLKKYYDDQETVQRFNDELEKTENTLDKYWDSMGKIMQEIDRGWFWKEPDEIIQIQKETGIDEWLEISNRMDKNLREK